MAKKQRKKNIVPCKKHKWCLVSWSRKILHFYCKKCQERVERTPTKEELKEIKAGEKVRSKNINEIHKLGHEFYKKFRNKDGYKKNGYDLMESVSKWAKKHPEVQITGCDDSHFMSSDLVLIPHQRKENGKVVEYWGTTMVYLPQNGIGTTEIFLYPGHVKGLQEALKKMKGPRPKYGPSPKFKF